MNIPFIVTLALIGSQVSDIKSLIPEQLHNIFLLLVAIILTYFAYVNTKGISRTLFIVAGISISMYISLSLFDYHPISNYRCDGLINKSENYYLDGDYASAYHTLSGTKPMNACSYSGEKKLKRFVQLAKINWKLGNQSSAAKQIDDVLKRTALDNRPLLYQAYRLQGNIYNEQQKWLNAEKSFANAIRFGKKDFRLIVDLAITKRRLDLNPEEDLIYVVKKLKQPENLEEKEILISAYRQLSSLTSDCKIESEYLHKAFSVASGEKKLTLYKTINYDDYIFSIQRCALIKEKKDIQNAYREGQKWLSTLSSSQNRNKALFNRSDKYAMLLRDEALKYHNLLQSVVNDANLTNKYILLRDKNIKAAENTVDTGKQYVNLITEHYSYKLRWWLTKATIANIRLDNETLKECIKNAKVLAKKIPLTNKKNWEALAEFYQLVGQVTNDPIMVLKAYSIYFSADVGRDSDLSTTQSYLNAHGIQGLPITKSSSIIVK